MAHTPRPSRRVTIKDVARESGVSPTTVSFVLNDTSGQRLPDTTRKRVRAAAEALGYSPHQIATTLRAGFSKVVLLDVGPVASGPGVDSLISGMREELSGLGYALLVLRGENAVPVRDIEEVVAPRAVIRVSEASASERSDDPDGGWSHGLAAHTLTQLRHLVDRGHRQIAFAAPERRLSGYVAARWSHVQEAARVMGLPAPMCLTVFDDADATRGAVAGLLAEHAPPTAVAGFNDDAALAVLAALSDLGLSAPADLAVIGFDAGPYGALWRPSLTTVQIDAAEYGRRSARLALGLDIEPWAGTPSVVVVRDSA